MKNYHDAVDYSEYSRPFGGCLRTIPSSENTSTHDVLRLLVAERLDPLVNSGVIGSPHIHQVVGGNSFNATMEPVTYDLPTRSTCTSCTFSEDFSNYWRAALYYGARNETFKRVEQFPNGGVTQNGGIKV
jgi:hypothetical protein